MLSYFFYKMNVNTWKKILKNIKNIVTNTNSAVTGKNE